MADEYSYGTSSYGGVTLHYIKTSSKNVRPTLVRPMKKINASGKYGINGGFFSGSNIVTIAVVNDVPVGGEAWAENVGWANNNLDRGTLVWDNNAREYKVPIVRRASDITVSDRGDYWAQGGVSTTLDDDTNWKQIMIDQKLPDYDAARQRAGMVYNSGLNLWLVVSAGGCTAEAFRTAIKKTIAVGTLKNGIFLDGGGSTSLYCSQNTVGCDREVPEMMALLKPTP